MIYLLYLVTVLRTVIIKKSNTSEGLSKPSYSFSVNKVKTHCKDDSSPPCPYKNSGVGTEVTSSVREVPLSLAQTDSCRRGPS